MTISIGHALFVGMEQIKQLIDSLPEGECLCTKEVAQRCGCSTGAAYRELARLCDDGVLERYGYRIAPGVWDGPESRSLRKSSLYWQKN